MSLRARLHDALPVTAPLVLNPLMARMAEAAGFAAIEIIEHMTPIELMAAKVEEAVAARSGAIIGIEKLLAVERATVEKGRA
jgi:hypothetical protein